MAWGGRAQQCQALGEDRQRSCSSPGQGSRGPGGNRSFPCLSLSCTWAFPCSATQGPLSLCPSTQLKRRKPLKPKLEEGRGVPPLPSPGPCPGPAQCQRARGSCVTQSTFPASGEALPPAEQEPLRQGKAPGHDSAWLCPSSRGSGSPPRRSRGGSRDRVGCKGRSVSGSA